VSAWRRTISTRTALSDVLQCLSRLLAHHVGAIPLERFVCAKDSFQRHLKLRTLARFQMPKPGKFAQTAYRFGADARARVVMDLRLINDAAEIDIDVDGLLLEGDSPDDFGGVNDSYDAEIEEDED
jgi:hypothetical protein